MENFPDRDPEFEQEPPKSRKQLLREQLAQELDHMFGEGYTERIRQDDKEEYLREWVWFLNTHDPAEALLYPSPNQVGVPKSMLYG